ncbi:hypothetical protein [Stenotrophomonas sp.]|uniref:hypothetical protein n=1 Tax=Stenotrophomonas sp. TaxID=69392 RepID=UPI00289B7311|nr:hypothetical protein [Stenotrophomonas sp.]
MTTSIPIQHATPVRMLDLLNLKAPVETTVESTQTVPMDAQTLRTLTEAVASRMLVEGENGDGRTAEAPVANLRASTISLREASERLAGIVSELPVILSALLGTQDPLKSEEGATVRAAEGAAAQAPLLAARDGAAMATATEGTTGVDADVGDRSANAGAWIASSSFSNLLALLRQLLLKFEKLDRDNSTKMVIMQREITILAGDKGVEKARENLGGTIGAAVMTGAIGGAALKQTFKSNSIQTDSMKSNLNAGNNTKVSAEASSGGIRSSATPSDELRPARNLNGSPVESARGSERAAADLQADTSVDRHAIDATMKATGQKTTEEAQQLNHGMEMARSQIPASQGMMLNMLAPGIGATVSSGVQIESEMTEAERQLALQVADVFRRIADEQQDQSAKTRDMRDAAAQLFESMLNLMSGTSAHIISKY